MFTHKNLMTVCCAAVLAFGLAACGSSSDDDNVAVTTPAVPRRTRRPPTAPDSNGCHEIAAADQDGEARSWMPSAAAQLPITDAP